VRIIMLLCATLIYHFTEFCAICNPSEFHHIESNDPAPSHATVPVVVMV